MYCSPYKANDATKHTSLYLRVFVSQGDERGRDCTKKIPFEWAQAYIVGVDEGVGAVQRASLAGYVNRLLTTVNSILGQILPLLISKRRFRTFTRLLPTFCGYLSHSLHATRQKPACDSPSLPDTRFAHFSRISPRPRIDHYRRG